MSRVFQGIRPICLTAAAAIIFTAGCGSTQGSSIANSVTVVPATLLASIVKSVQQPVARALAGWEWSSYFTNFGALLSNFQNTIVMHKVIYNSTGADGSSHTMTGLLILPQSLFGSKPSVPILMYQHGTEPYRPFSPSQYLNHRARPTDYPEVMVMAAIASAGYAVAMVDYEGMGDNTNTQPHVVGEVLA